MKKPISFKFNRDKFIHLMTYLVEKIGPVDRLKAAKMLYFIDKYHLVTQGKPIIGDTYVRMDHGPVPSISYDIIKDACSRAIGKDSENRDEFLKYIKVHNPNRLGRRYHQFSHSKSADTSIFSKAELNSIEEIIKRYGDKSGIELEEISHKHPTWKNVEINAFIDFRLFFLDDPDVVEGTFEYMEEQQEDRDFLNEF